MRDLMKCDKLEKERKRLEDWKNGREKSKFSFIRIEWCYNRLLIEFVNRLQLFTLKE